MSRAMREDNGTRTDRAEAPRGGRAADMFAKVSEGMAVRTAIGEPVITDGLTVIPVAKVAGAGGGGGGVGPGAPGQEPSGNGAGMALASKPVGVFVIKNGKVGWRPAVDVNRVILGGQIVAIVALLVVRSIVRARRRRWALTR
jgi:uncharacterized spore protein YtfJ